MKNSLLFLLLLSCSVLSAQTKMIAHKSHGGSSADFRTALEVNDALLAGSDFGVGPVQNVTIARLDTVIFISEQEQIMITSACYYRAERGTDRPISDTTTWQPGTERVYEHELFSQRDRLPWIKRQLDRHYNFTNPADSVVFIGYGEDPAVQEPQPAPTPNPPVDGQQEQGGQQGGQQPEGGQAPAPRKKPKKAGQNQENDSQQQGLVEVLESSATNSTKMQAMQGSVFSSFLPFRKLTLLVISLSFLGFLLFRKK